jgi:glycosyltransferase involved in cell wall biosynthesis
MRLCIPIEVRPEGGMYTFVANFIAWLQRTNRPYTQDLEGDYDVLFVNSWVVRPDIVRRLKRERVALRVAHRVDGAAIDYGSNPASDPVQARVNLYADVTIFQSKYSKFSTREKYRVIPNDGPVVYNPVDTSLFDVKGTMINLPTDTPLVACASWSVNERKGTWQIEELAERNPDITFVLCGRFESVSSRANVVRLGHLSRTQMAEALRSCDVFLNLSENDPCPNVVLEALASGLPVLYRDSGGVPELVADCGEPIEIDTFKRGLYRVLTTRELLARRARSRAVEQFSVDTIFPKYWDAIFGASRQPLPKKLTVLKLASAGYPVLPPVKTPAQIARAIARRAPGVLRDAGVRRPNARYRIGWVTYDSFPNRKRHFRELDSFTGMRVGNVARWINDNDPELANELYIPDRRYDLVVFQKVMDARAQAEADKIRAYGGRVVFDANVNYYQIEGDYFVPGTRPTDEQRRDAHTMTQRADWVVADSSYLVSVIEPLNSHVSWIPDNVNTAIYDDVRDHRHDRTLHLVWSGIGKKAAHLLAIRDVLQAMQDIDLTLVVDETPDFLQELQSIIPCRVVAFSDRRYARTLRQSDVIISPKRLVNAYEAAHTEYKITLGMAVGLPAVASAQQSYAEAINHRGGGIVARDSGEWHQALTRLRDPALRRDLGARARQTVVERYATPVIAAQYARLLRDVMSVRVDAASAVH